MVPNAPVEKDEFIAENYLRSSKFCGSSMDGFLQEFVEISPKRLVKLPNDIDMTVAIDITRLDEWNDFDGIEVIDGDFGQPYQPFYMYREKDGKHLIAGRFPFLEKIYQVYDREMDLLVEQGIFVRKVFA